MESSLLAGWSDFLVAAAGVTGALVGLLFVSLSINLSRIIESRGISGRAAETVILLGGILAESLVLLIPHLSAFQLGIALAVIALPTWGIPTLIQIQSARKRTYFRVHHAVIRGVLHQLAALPGILAVLAVGGWLRGGLAWFAIGVVMSIVVAMINAWVLLVEILR